MKILNYNLFLETMQFASLTNAQKLAKKEEERRKKNQDNTKTDISDEKDDHVGDEEAQTNNGDEEAQTNNGDESTGDESTGDESKNHILESTVGGNINKTLLFEILKNSEYVQKFDYLWSPNLSVGGDIIFVDLDEKDFFDKDKSVYEIIGELWPYGDYDKWKNLYYGLVYGYKIKDKNSDTSILIQIIRYEKSILPIGGKEFDFYINPNYKKEIEGEKIFIDDKIMNLFGFDDTESNNVKNNFSEMGEQLSRVTKTMENYKIIFKYLDAVI